MPEPLVEPMPAPSAAPQRGAVQVPSGFEVLQFGAGPSPRPESPGAGERLVIVKSSGKERLLAAGVGDPRRMGAGPLVCGWLEGGRTRHALIRSAGDLWVLKEYRRGGVLGRWNANRYWGRERFFEELRVAALAEANGIPTAEVLALILEAAGLGSVKGWLITRYLPAARPLHECFGDPLEEEVFRAAGSVVRAMHRLGIDHPDLHLGNIVTAANGHTASAHVVDWDRARRRVEGSWNPYGNLVRLWRSVLKGRHLGALGRGQEPLDARLVSRPVRAFIRGYFDGRPSDLKQARAYFRKRTRFLGVRTLFWKRRHP